MPKSKEFISSSSESDSEDSEPKSKKKKKAEKRKREEAEEEKSTREEKPKEVKKKPAKNAAGEYSWQLSKYRFASVSEFRGKVMVNIREFYEKEGELLPGKKGISLQLDQWQKLKESMDEIDDAIKEIS